MGNASMDDTDIAVIMTFFFVTDGKSFVSTFNCSIHNMSKYRWTCLLIHLCLQASFFNDRTPLNRWGSKHRRIQGGRGWWHRQQHDIVIELYGMYLHRKMMTMYCCLKTMDCHLFMFFVKTKYIDL
jgi:hypothetical protein